MSEPEDYLKGLVGQRVMLWRSGRRNLPPLHGWLYRNYFGHYYLWGRRLRNTTHNHRTLYLNSGDVVVPEPSTLRR